MRFDTRVFRLSKDPDQPSGYQDACAVDAEQGIAAIADGVSSALFSGPWAEILTEAAVAENPDPGDPEAFAWWLQNQRQKWPSRIDTSSLAWFQRAKLPTGAFSTLLWLQVSELDSAQPGSFGGFRFRAHAIGDSCLFHLRGGELVRSFPLQSSAEMQADPIVLGSIDLKRDQYLQFATIDEVCYGGDQLILCTDALAEWALQHYESGEPPIWDDFWQMSDEDWRAGILWLRQERQMKTDDTTMLLMRVVGQEAAAEPEADLVEPTVVDESNSPLDWLREASQEVRSASADIAEQADQASERMLHGINEASEKMKQGFKSLKDIAMQKYREKFGKKAPPRK